MKSHSTNDDDDKMILDDQIDSPSNDEDSSGGSLSGGGGQVLKKGPWTSAEDDILMDYVKKHGEGNWNAVQKHSGLSRCGKSCRLRWANHLRPNLKKGAFTPEEEQLIIELHYKMGNKWARMAVYLPGRTDNEIKNYWNTRIKRRQRAGLPLYPASLVSEENQHGLDASEYSCTDIQSHEVMQGSNFDVPDVIFDNFNSTYGVLPYAPPFLEIPPAKNLSQGFASPNYGLGNLKLECTDHFGESQNLQGTVSIDLPPLQPFWIEHTEEIEWGSGLGYPYDPDPDPGIRNLAPFEGALPSSHDFLNGYNSASRPIAGPAKVELPSLQYTSNGGGGSLLACPSTPIGAIDTLIESPTTVSLHSECVSPRNSGLLEALLHESRSLGTSRKLSSEKSSSSSVVTPNDIMDDLGLNFCDTEWEDYNDAISPFDQSVISAFNDCIPPFTVSSLEELPPSKAPTNDDAHVSTSDAAQNDLQSHPDLSRLDALLESGWLQGSSKHAKDSSVFNDAIEALNGQGLSHDVEPAAEGTSSILAQGYGLDTFPWRIMPSARQVSEFH